jgi:hypothetical protein
MLQEKANSPTLDQSQLGIDKLRSINPNLDLGNGLTVPVLAAAIEETRTTIASYNTTVAELERTNRMMKEQEQALASLLKRIVLAVGAKYGENSEEYKALKKVLKRQRRRNTTTKTSPQPVELLPNLIPQPELVSP